MDTPGVGGGAGSTYSDRSLEATPATGLAGNSTAHAASDTAALAGDTGLDGMEGTNGLRAGRDDEVMPVVVEAAAGWQARRQPRARACPLLPRRGARQREREPASERAVVERRPVDRALAGAEAAFTDRVIEAEEHTEEAVVAKGMRVEEEIGLRREAEERTDTVSGMVRRTEVEIDDERAERRLAGERRATDKIPASFSKAYKACPA